MLDKNAFLIVSEILDAECFYVDAHKVVFSAFKRLYKKNYPLDMLTVIDELKRANKLESANGVAAIAALTNCVTGGESVEMHSRIVYQKYVNRELIKLSADVIKLAYEGADSFDLLDFVADKVSSLGAAANSGTGMVSIGSAVVDAIGLIDKWRATKSDITGVPSGFEELDKITRGWQPGDLIIIGARPSVGKTAMALNLVRNAAQNNIKSVTVAVWSLEMKATFLALRMLASESKMLLDKLQTGNITDGEMTELMKGAADSLSKMGIFFDEKVTVSINSIITKAKRLKKTHDLGLIVIDYLQLIQGDSSKVREQQISDISRQLKKLASEIQVPIIALSQLSRESGVKNVTWEFGPHVSSLRESGALEQDADVIAMLWGASDVDIQQDPSLAKRRKLRVAKQRNGVLGTVDLDFQNEIQLFQTIIGAHSPINCFTDSQPENNDEDVF